MKEVLKSIRSDYFSFIAVGFLIAVTANTFFYTTNLPIYIGCIIYSFIFIKKSYKINLNFNLIILIILFLLIGQSYTNGVFLPFTIIGKLVRILLAYFVIRLVNKNFFTQYVNFVYITAVIGFFIYLIFIIFPDFISFCEVNITPYVQPPFQGDIIRKHIIIYDYSNLKYTRFLDFGLNAGFYWEPGAQAIFLVFAIIFHSFSTNTFFNKINIVMIIILLTTFSTTGYLAIIIFGIIFQIISSKNKIVTLFLSSILSLLIYTSIFSEIPFLKAKIEDDISLVSSEQNEGSRFQSLYLDYLTAIQNPFFGIDINANEESEYENGIRNKENHRNNGIGIILGNHGFLGLILYLFAIYLSIKKLKNSWNLQKESIIGLLFMFIFLNFGMPLTLRPFFYALMLLFLIPNNFNKTLTYQ
jgi:hypothetical protein